MAKRRRITAHDRQADRENLRKARAALHEADRHLSKVRRVTAADRRTDARNARRESPAKRRRTGRRVASRLRRDKHGRFLPRRR